MRRQRVFEATPLLNLRETGKIDRLAAKVEAAIARLQEYRAALITAAVTGKIDISTSLDSGVREAVGAGEALAYPDPGTELMKAAESTNKSYAADRKGKSSQKGNICR